MPRRRKDSSLGWMPDRVYIQRNKFVFQPKQGGKITLCSVEDGKLTCIKRYEQSLAKLDDKHLFKSLIDAFFKSQQFKELSTPTQKQYGYYRDLVAKAFGKMKPDSIKQHHIRLYMDKLANTNKSKPANATANRHKALIQKICSWALERGKIKANPCIGVKKLKEVARKRYIEDFEYNAIYNAAVPSCQLAMEIAYLCMARISDVVGLKLTDIQEQGLLIEQGKTGVKQLKLWTPRLLNAIERCKALPCKKGMSTIFLFNKEDGSRYTVRAIQAQYKAACEFSGVVGVTFHDLKAKGISDFEGSLAEKSDAAGHTNLAMTKRYDRKTKQVRSVK